MLSKRDLYIKSQGPWDRRARMQTAEEASEDIYLKFLAAQARDWPAAQQKKVARVIERARKGLQRWKLPFPPQVLFVHTTGNEEGQAAYCRENAVVLPASMLRMDEEALTELVLHEFFHVLSSHNPELRARMYAVIGFSYIGRVDLPQEIEALRITNPDAPVVEHAVEIQLEDGPVRVAPLLLAKEPYDAKKGGTLFDYLDFKLLAVETDGKGATKAAFRDDKPWLLDPRLTQGYHERIGSNTGYIIHPEEIMADNFAYVVLGRKEAPTPRILEEVRKILESPGTGLKER